MLHHAVHLISANRGTLAPTLTGIFQAAAERAWLRRATATAIPSQSGGPENVVSCNKDSDLSDGSQAYRDKSVRSLLHTDQVAGSKLGGDHPSSPSQRRTTFRERLNLSKQPFAHNSQSCSRNKSRKDEKRRPPNPRVTNIIPIDVDSLSDHDTSFYDPGRAPPYYIYRAHGKNTTVISPGPLRTHPIPSPPRPLTPAALYQNLLYLLSRRHPPPPSLSALISYHGSFHRQPTLYSTRSFNLLISLAIRNAAFGPAQRLLATMRARGLRGDLETWKLRIRWLIRVGRWGDAWKEVMRDIGRDGYLDSKMSSQIAKGTEGMPLPIWLEFFGTMKRGAIRTRRREQNSTRDQGERALRKPALDAVQEMHDQVATDSARYLLLMHHLPRLTPSERARTPPRAVYLAVQMMLRMGQKQAAMTFTEAYLRGLPPEIDDKWAGICLCIIHLHVVFEPGRGLPAHRASRKVVNSLLAIHRQLRPNSTTMFLLLRHLKRAERCGSIAQAFLDDFRKRWGLRTVDQRVRRRVASLALKEGRMDIVEAMLNTERVLGWPRRMWAMQRDVLGGAERKVYQRLIRRPAGEMFRKKGREGRRWTVLRRRVRRRMKQA